jgi:hypothetical protein
VLEARARTALADIQAEMGDPGAVEEAERALELHRATGHRPGEAQTLALLGRLSTGEQSLRYQLAAIELFEELGAPEAAELRELTAL